MESLLSDYGSICGWSGGCPCVPTWYPTRKKLYVTLSVSQESQHILHILNPYFVTVISRVVELYPLLSTGLPSLSTKSSLTVCLPLIHPLSQMGSHLSRYFASPPSIE